MKKKKDSELRRGIPRELKVNNHSSQLQWTQNCVNQALRMLGINDIHFPDVELDTIQQVLEGYKTVKRICFLRKMQNKEDVLAFCEQLEPAYYFLLYAVDLSGSAEGHAVALIKGAHKIDYIDLQDRRAHIGHLSSTFVSCWMMYQH